MKLTIIDVSSQDLGEYKCVAKNPRGETEGTIRVYGRYNFFFFVYLKVRFQDRIYKFKKYISLTS